MTKNKDKEAYYFSHDSNARNDQKIIRMLMKLDWYGYGLYWALIECLRDATAYRLQCDYELIAYNLRCDVDKLKALINDFDLFVIEKNYFYSSSLNRRMKVKENKRKQAQEAANKRWGNRGKNESKDDADALENDANALESECGGNANKNKIKIKEKKLNQLKEKLVSNGWTGDFEKLMEKYGFDVIDCYWNNCLEKDLINISDKCKGGRITKKIKAEAVEFYHSFVAKQKEAAAQAKQAEEYQELYVSGAAKWSLMDHSERKILHQKAIEETDLISTLHENGEIQNKRIEERIFLEIGKNAD